MWNIFEHTAELVVCGKAEEGCRDHQEEGKALHSNREQVQSIGIEGHFGMEDWTTLV